MRIKFLILSICLLLMITLTACGPGYKAITDTSPLGYAAWTDTIFTVEPRANNSLTVWATHDDVGAYCTLDQSLSKRIMDIYNSGNHVVRVRYRSINDNDAEKAWIADLGTAGCATDRATTVYKITGIEIIEAHYISTPTPTAQ